ncbi:hypothetical protein QR680_007151 [Steinernema hermaphroditum]|uniref:RING-type domain-containing protein n=1 Tax=Steinernema hermaphroditum TaxID=289476 RepID=A0AA39HXV0_9BILA|nr:hypothetical protein QR680_007151 [Steinernema hermaphroditum]
MSTSSTCAICLSDFVERVEIAKTPCGHFYHIECINRALVESRRCPYCRADVVGVERIQANTRTQPTGSQFGRLHPPTQRPTCSGPLPGTALYPNDVVVRLGNSLTMADQLQHIERLLVEQEETPGRILLNLLALLSTSRQE